MVERGGRGDRGDRVLVGMGRVVPLELQVEIADGVRVRQVRSMVTGVRAKGEPVKDDAS